MTASPSWRVRIDAPGLASTAYIRNAFERGDARALDDVFQSLYPTVLGFVEQRMGVRLRAVEEPADVVQETFMQALRSLGRVRIRGRGSLFGWLAVVAENVIRGRADHFRARKRDGGSVVPLHEICAQADSEPESGTAGPVDDAARAETIAHLRACLDALPPAYREVVQRRRLEEQSLLEVARSMRRPSVQAVSMLCRRAEQRLAREIRRT